LQHRTGFKGITRPARPNNCDYGAQKATVDVVSTTKTPQKVAKITLTICGVLTAWAACGSAAPPVMTCAENAPAHGGMQDKAAAE